jgi:hypothetical protein
MPVIGEAECQRVGSECPAGDWPAAIPEAEQVIYVQPGAQGDGSSKAAAVGTISDAVELAQEGALIVLSKGIHFDNIVIEKSLKMLGACPEETIVEGETGMGNFNIGPNADTPMPSYVNESGAHLAVLYLANVPGANRQAIDVDLQDFMIRGDNVGIAVNGGQEPFVTAHLKHLILDNLKTAGVLIQGKNSSLNASSILVQNTQSGDDLIKGHGVSVRDGIAKLERSYLTGNHQGGVTCDSASNYQAFAGLEVSNTIVADSKSLPVGSFYSGTQGYGISAWKCDMQIERSLIENNRMYGIGSFCETDDPTIHTITDVVVRSTNPVPELRTSENFPWMDCEGGSGILLWGGEAYLNRVFLENNSTMDIAVIESAYPCNVTTGGSCEKTYAVIENLTSRSVRMDSTGHFGSGIGIMDGAEAVVSKASFDGSHYAGALVTDAMRRNGSGDTLALFTDVTITNVASSEVGDKSSGSNETFGDGIVVSNGALASFSRFKVSEVERVGVLLNGRYNWEEIEEQFGKRDLVSKEAVERSKRDKKGKRDSVLSFGSVEKAKVGINNQMLIGELGKRDSVEELSNDVSTSETESAYSTDAIAIPAFSFLNKEFMEAVFGAAMESQEQ